jgi:hypothetical protein
VISDDDYELFKWDVLADAATGGLQMLYEPLGWARWQFPALLDDERAALAERVLRELLADGLIAFERAGRPMSPAEVESAIAGDEWRVVPLGPDGAGVEFFATEAGQARYHAAPEQVIAAWNARARDTPPRAPERTRPS